MGFRRIVYFFCFGVLLLVFHVLQLLAYALTGQLGQQKVVGWLNWCLIQNLRILKVKNVILGKENIPDRGNLVITANHSNEFDIPGIVWTLRKYSPVFVAKKSLRWGIPSISLNIRIGGSVTIDRKNPEEALKKMDAFKKTLIKQQRSVGVFPEGTRRPTLEPFKTKGLMHLKQLSPDALVLPVIVHNTAEIFNKERTDKLTLYFEILPAFPISELTEEYISKDLWRQYKESLDNPM